MMPLFGSDTLSGQPPLGSERCYPLFEQGPCGDGQWFVLNSALDRTLLPKAHCEKAPDCSVYVLKTEFEGMYQSSIYDGLMTCFHEFSKYQSTIFVYIFSNANN